MRPLLIAMVGAPGSGKSTTALAVAAAQEPRAMVLSLDQTRAQVSPFHDPCDQNVTPTAVARLHAELSAYLRRGRSVVVDGAHTTCDARLALLAIAAIRRALTVAVVMTPPLAELQRRNATRSTTVGRCGFASWVPDAYLAECHAHVAAALPLLPAEGWDAVVVRPA
ncbi:MAG: AAA family ATPase [Pseudonocardiaceae bacterium]